VPLLAALSKVKGVVRSTSSGGFPFAPVHRIARWRGWAFARHNVLEAAVYTDERRKKPAAGSSGASWTSNASTREPRNPLRSSAANLSS